MPEGSTGLHVIHKKGDIIERSVGHIGAIPTHLMLVTPESAFEGVQEGAKSDLEHRFRDIPWKGNVEVYLNHSPLFRRLKRLFRKERLSSLFTRVSLGIPTTINDWAWGKLTRKDSYNPWNESAQVYHSNKAVAFHEVGHAIDFDQSSKKSRTLKELLYLIPFARTKLEWNASRNAMKHLTKDERQEAAKLYEPALGSYVASDVSRVAGFFGLPFSPALAFGPILLGHAHSSLTKRNIFFNGNKKVSINPLSLFRRNVAPAYA